MREISLRSIMSKVPNEYTRIISFIPIRHLLHTHTYLFEVSKCSGVSIVGFKQANFTYSFTLFFI